MPLLLAGTAARGLVLRDGVLADVTPTILAWLRLPVAADMDGAPAGFARSEAVGRIATYDTRPIERLASGASGVEEDIKDELRALGYIK